MFEMVRNNGTVRKVWGYGIETIMESPDPLDLSSVRSLFPHIPKEVFAPSSKKPVDILMGNNFLGLHPDGGIGRDAFGDMRAYQSQFGLGWVLAGTHPDIKPGSSKLSANALNLARIFKCEVIPELLPSIWEGECLGVLPPKRCGKCLRCSQSSDPGLIHSRKEQEELENMTEMRKYCPVEDIHYVARELNPADVGTRGFAKVADLGPDSFWQRGPAFLCSRRDLWPVSRDFVREEVPDDEVRGKTVSQPVFCAWLRATYMNSSVRDVPLPDLWHAVLRAIQYSNNLDKVLRILAMVIVGWKMKSEGHPPTKEGVEVISAGNLESAEKLFLLSAMPETVSAAQAGKLVSLNPEKAGAIIVTSGRIGEESLSRILGVPYLPILMASSRAAYLYMVRAHEEEFGTVHCSVAETLLLSLALPPGVELSYPELVTLLARISYTVNSRPLGLANVSQSDNQEDIMMPISPNMMLLSRSSSNSPPMEYSPDDKFCASLSYVAQVEKEWWDRWIKTVLPTLFKYKRWKTKQRNLEVGELVMLKYPG